MLELTLLQFAHVLGLVYWLGGDLGVFYSSLYAVNRNLSQESRVMAIRMLFALDLGPRICMTMILPVGLHLAWRLGFLPFPATIMGLIWLVCFGWLAMVLFLHFRHNSPAHAALARFDFAFRLVVISMLAGYALVSLASSAGARVDWVAWKMLIFAGMIACGLMIRVKLKPFGPAFSKLVAGQATAEVDQAISGSIAATRPWVLVIWLGLLGSAFIGLWSM